MKGEIMLKLFRNRRPKKNVNLSNAYITTTNDYSIYANNAFFNNTTTAPEILRNSTIVDDNIASNKTLNRTQNEEAEHIGINASHATVYRADSTGAIFVYGIIISSVVAVAVVLYFMIRALINHIKYKKRGTGFVDQKSTDYSGMIMLAAHNFPNPPCAVRQHTRKNNARNLGAKNASETKELLKRGNKRDGGQTKVNAIVHAVSPSDEFDDNQVEKSESEKLSCDEQSQRRDSCSAQTVKSMDSCDSRPSQNDDDSHDEKKSGRRTSTTEFRGENERSSSSSGGGGGGGDGGSQRSSAKYATSDSNGTCRSENGTGNSSTSTADLKTSCSTESRSPSSKSKTTSISNLSQNTENVYAGSNSADSNDGRCTSTSSKESRSMRSSKSKKNSEYCSSSENEQQSSRLTTSASSDISETGGKLGSAASQSQSSTSSKPAKSSQKSDSIGSDSRRSSDSSRSVSSTKSKKSSCETYSTDRTKKQSSRSTTSTGFDTCETKSESGSSENQSRSSKSRSTSVSDNFSGKPAKLSQKSDSTSSNGRQSSDDKCSTYDTKSETSYETCSSVGKTRSQMSADSGYSDSIAESCSEADEKQTTDRKISVSCSSDKSGSDKSGSDKSGSDTITRGICDSKSSTISRASNTSGCLQSQCSETDQSEKYSDEESYSRASTISQRTFICMHATRRSDRSSRSTIYSNTTNNDYDDENRTACSTVDSRRSFDDYSSDNDASTLCSRPRLSTPRPNVSNVSPRVSNYCEVEDEETTEANSDATYDSRRASTTASRPMKGCGAVQISCRINDRSYSSTRTNTLNSSSDEPLSINSVAENKTENGSSDSDCKNCLRRHCFGLTNRFIVKKVKQMDQETGSQIPVTFQLYLGSLKSSADCRNTAATEKSISNAACGTTNGDKNRGILSREKNTDGDVNGGCKNCNVSSLSTSKIDNEMISTKRAIFSAPVMINPLPTALKCNLYTNNYKKHLQKLMDELPWCKKLQDQLEHDLSTIRSINNGDASTNTNSTSETASLSGLSEISEYDEIISDGISNYPDQCDCYKMEYAITDKIGKRQRNDSEPFECHYAICSNAINRRFARDREKKSSSDSDCKSAIEITRINNDKLHSSSDTESSTTSKPNQPSKPNRRRIPKMLSTQSTDRCSHIRSNVSINNS